MFRQRFCAHCSCSKLSCCVSYFAECDFQESRVLKFWFAVDTDYLDKVTGAYEFFKELVKPDNFPRGT